MKTATVFDGLHLHYYNYDKVSNLFKLQNSKANPYEITSEFIKIIRFLKKVKIGFKEDKYMNIQLFFK